MRTLSDGRLDGRGRPRSQRRSLPARALALIALRERAGLTQAEMAQLLRLTPKHLSRLECGDREVSEQTLYLARLVVGQEPTPSRLPMAVTTSEPHPPHPRTKKRAETLSFLLFWPTFLLSFIRLWPII